MQTKICSKCNQERPITEFYEKSGRPGKYQSYCKSCCRDYYQTPEQKQKSKEQTAIYRESHRQERREQSRKWYANIKELIRPRRKKYDHERWMNNPDVRARKNEQKTQRVKERMKTEPGFIEKVRKWRRIIMQNRRENSRDGHVTAKEWDELCAKYDYRCLCCGEKKPLTIDHVIPLARGGTHSIDNVQPLCVDCNRKKHTKTIDYRTK